MDARELLSGLAVVEISTSCRVSLDTARRWKRRGRCPPGMHVLLELTLDGELGRLAPAFRGWHLVAHAGELVSPDGWRFTPGEICSLPLQFGRIRELERQVRELVVIVEGRADRRARVDALAAAAAGLQLVSRALEQLAGDLTDRERARHFEIQKSLESDSGPRHEPARDHEHK